MLLWRINSTVYIIICNVQGNGIIVDITFRSFRGVVPGAVMILISVLTTARKLFSRDIDVLVLSHLLHVTLLILQERSMVWTGGASAHPWVYYNQYNKQNMHEKQSPCMLQASRNTVPSMDQVSSILGKSISLKKLKVLDIFFVRCSDSHVLYYVDCLKLHLAESHRSIT